MDFESSFINKEDTIKIIQHLHKAFKLDQDIPIIVCSNNSMKCELVGVGRYRQVQCVAIKNSGEL